MAGTRNSGEDPPNEAPHNGINQPLAVTGQEAAWQAVGRRLGMTDAEIDAFLAGPPYLPFSYQFFII